MRINLDGNALFTAFEMFVSDQRNGTTSKAVARIGEGEHLIVATTKALASLKGYVKRNLGVMILLASKSVSAGSARGGRCGEKVKSLLGKASFAKKIGLSKANSVTNALKNGEDFPQGHRKPSSAAV